MRSASVPASSSPEVSGHAPSAFEWRAPLGAWRWLIVAALGVGASDCGGDAETPPNDFGPSACEGETALEAGLSRCSNGLLHRQTAEACSMAWSAPPFDSVEASLVGFSYPFQCGSDAECADGPYGHCVSGDQAPHCEYGCLTDDDCSVSQLCFCGADGGQCIESSCRTDAECGGDRLCANHVGCNAVQFLCQTSSDECAVDADCRSGQSCILQDFNVINPLVSPSGYYRACRAAGCPVIGRPFLVDGLPRSAPRVERSDWSSSVDTEIACPSSLTSELRAEVARGWTEQALMEHASVAAFARFALQLMALGAPAELVAGAAAAMQDEIRHAQGCFRLARRYTSDDIGPGSLPVAGALDEWDLTTVVLATVREGCIGETLAALDAAEALQHCDDEAARPVLACIAAEETGHAQLAWRFVAWALQTTRGTPRGSELRRSVRAAFAAELETIAPAATGSVGEAPIREFDRELARHGLLSLPVRQALRDRALREVVAPCAAALLEPRPAAGRARRRAWPRPVRDLERGAERAAPAA